jgi:hypothetical protein
MNARRSHAGLLLGTVLLGSTLGLGACGTGATTSDTPTGGASGTGGAPATGGRGGAPASTGGSGGSSTPGGTGGSAATGGAGGGSTGGAGGAPTATGGAGGGSAGTAVPLPMSVTAQFQNQGWFADPGLAMSFKPGSTIIKQVDGTTGPCAARPANARGKCLKITYTPPAGLVAPATGGWVGVFFLTTLLNPHTELMPPAAAGDANWGVEPGRNIAPGAMKISFSAAAEQDGLAVTFKAGTDKDSFVLPEQSETLGTAWKALSLSLAGQSYGTNVVGAFAWVLKDTGKAATFYLDNIVWE